MHSTFQFLTIRPSNTNAFYNSGSSRTLNKVDDALGIRTSTYSLGAEPVDMINFLWMAMIVVGVIFAMFGGAPVAQSVTKGVLDSADSAVKFTIGLIGILAFWSGMMKIVEEAGLTVAIGKLLAPIIRRLFPSVPKDHPASASIVMSIIANLLGIGHAATPLGIKAMEDLQSLNGGRSEASDAMCTFIVLCTSSLTLIPATVIAIRTAAGSVDPAAIVGTTLVATTTSTLTAITFDRLFRGVGRRNR